MPRTKASGGKKANQEQDAENSGSESASSLESSESRSADSLLAVTDPALATGASSDPPISLNFRHLSSATVAHELNPSLGSSESYPAFRTLMRHALPEIPASSQHQAPSASHASSAAASNPAPANPQIATQPAIVEARHPVQVPPTSPFPSTAHIEDLVQMIRANYSPEQLAIMAAALRPSSTASPVPHSRNRGSPIVLHSTSPPAHESSVIHHQEIVQISSSVDSDDVPLVQRRSTRPRDDEPPLSALQTEQRTPGEHAFFPPARHHPRQRSPRLDPQAIQDMGARVAPFSRYIAGYGTNAPPDTHYRANQNGFSRRCPRCFTTDLVNHNSLTCNKAHHGAPRSADEDQACLQIAAIRSAMRESGNFPRELYQNSYRMYNGDDDDFGDDDNEDVQDGPQPQQSIAARAPPQDPSLTQRRQVDPRVAAVVEDERRSRAAGVDTIQSESRSRDSSVSHSSSSRPATSIASTSSYAPSSSSAFSETPTWASQLQSDVKALSDALRGVVDIQRQQQLQLAQLPMPNYGYPPQMPFPGFYPGMVPPSHMWQDPGAAFMGHLPPPAPQAPPQQQPHPATQGSGAAGGQAWHRDDGQQSGNDRNVHFDDQLGTVSANMLHTNRPQGTMRGAPELAPEDLGNVEKFNEFLKEHSQYAALARERAVPWLSVAGLLTRYADDLAIAFTACALKRGVDRQYSGKEVQSLHDNDFERLYLEACAPSIVYPSQAIADLNSTVFIRQLENEATPMPALLRASEAFRVKLRLLPPAAVSKCTPESLRIAFLTALFGADLVKTKKLDFQECRSWTDIKTALIHRVTSDLPWFGDVMKEQKPPTPSKGKGSDKMPSQPSSPSRSGAASESSTSSNTSKNESHWAEVLAKEKKKASYNAETMDPAIEGLSSKAAFKKITSMRFRNKLVEEIKEGLTKDSSASAPAGPTTAASARVTADSTVADLRKQVAELQGQVRAQASQRPPSREHSRDAPRYERSSDYRGHQQSYGQGYNHQRPIQSSQERSHSQERQQYNPEQRTQYVPQHLSNAPPPPPPSRQREPSPAQGGRGGGAANR